MVKRFLTVLVIVCFTVSVATPGNSLAATQEEKDADQARTVNAMIGLVALVGIVFMLSKMGSSAKLDDDKDKVYLASLKKPEEKEGVDFGLDFSDSGFIQSDPDNRLMSKNNKWQSPTLKLGYRW